MMPTPHHTRTTPTPVPPPELRRKKKMTARVLARSSPSSKTRSSLVLGLRGGKISISGGLRRDFGR